MGLRLAGAFWWQGRLNFFFVKGVCVRDAPASFRLLLQNLSLGLEQKSGRPLLWSVYPQVMSSWDYVLLDPEKEPRSSLLRPVTLAGMITFVLLGTGGWLSRSIFSDIEGKSGFGGPTGPVPHSSAQTAGEDGKPGGPGLLQLVGLEEDCPGVQTRMLEPTPFQSLVQDGVVLQWQWDHKGQLRFRTYQGEQKPQLKSRTNQEGKEGKEGKEGGSDRGEWVAGCDKCFRGQHRLRPAAQKLCQVGTSTAVCASHAALARDATFPVFAEQTVREAGISLKGGRKRLRTLPRPGPTSTVLQFGQLMQYRNNTRGEMVFRTINSTRSKYQWRSACLACFKTK
eukprot:g28973.t1